MSITIDTNAGAGNSTYIDTASALQQSNNASIVQRIENRNYLICMVENYSEADTESCISIEKATGKAAVLDTFPSDAAFRLRLSFENQNTFVLKQTTINSDELSEYKKYDLAVQQYMDFPAA